MATLGIVLWLVCLCYFDIPPPKLCDYCPPHHNTVAASIFKHTPGFHGFCCGFHHTHAWSLRAAKLLAVLQALQCLFIIMVCLLWSEMWIAWEDCTARG